MNFLSTVGRQAVGLALAATLLVPPALAQAEEPIVRDHRGPMARIEIVVKKIRVLKDRDIGNGEMLFQMGLYCVPRTAPCRGQSDSTIDGFRHEFSATDGQIVTVDRVLPVPGSGNPSDAASLYLGYPVYRGHQYELVFSMWEQDGVYSADEYMGDHVIPLTQENAFGIGSYNSRSTRDGGSTPGDYELEFEIRRAPVPDLRATGIKIHDLVGSTKKLVCMGVTNANFTDAGPFTMALEVNGIVPPGGAVTAGRLGAGESGELCGEVTLPADGQHTLTAVADPQHSVVEFNEINNVHEQPYVASVVLTQTGPTTGQANTAPNAETGDAGKGSSAPVTLPAPSQGQADLTVSAIKVNGQVPDGKDDCKDGKNAVTVVVKNSGSEKAGGFAVRLDADGDEVGVESIDGLEAGKEREVRFADVKLKKGEHKLDATVDSKKAVAESDEENNARKASARCTEGS